jgi:hypothetical protein
MVFTDFCDCCHDAVSSIELFHSHTGMQNILDNDFVENLNKEGLTMIEWCVDFLLFQQKYLDYCEYITISFFICDFLGLEKNSGYDYYLLTWLEENHIMKHGNSIRRGGFKDYDRCNKYKDRILSEERKQILLDWAMG